MPRFTAVLLCAMSVSASVVAQTPPAPAPAPAPSGPSGAPAATSPDASSAVAPSPTPPPSAPTEPVSVTRRGFGTRVQIMVMPPAGEAVESKRAAIAAVEAALTEIERVHGLLSERSPQSEITKINKGAGGAAPVAVSAETARVLQIGKQVAAASSGAFAMTSGALLSLWDFEQPTDAAKRIPSSEQLVPRLPLVDDAAIALDVDKGTVRLPTSGMSLALPGIAKSYALTRALESLATAGFTNALVSIGGDVAARGSKGGAPWLVGIQDPRGETYFATLALKDEAIAVRGDYERFFLEGGKRYHPWLDPKSGLPAANARSVAVIGPDAATAGALATAAFVLGADKGLALVEKTPGAQALIVDAKNQVSMSKGLKERVRIVRAPSDAAPTVPGPAPAPTPAAKPAPDAKPTPDAKPAPAAPVPAPNQ